MQVFAMELASLVLTVVRLRGIEPIISSEGEMRKRIFSLQPSEGII